MIDPYNVLQVQRDAEPEVIRAAHRALARKHHPDFGGDPKRMAAINLAWSILGNPARRSRYDAAPQAAYTARGHAATPTPPTSPMPAAPTPPASPSSTEAVDIDTPTAAGRGLSARRLTEQRDGGTVLDFGRYAGWSIGTLADQDPNYLRWLARTPIGRRLTAEIDAALDRRVAETSAFRPNPVNPPRRQGLFASLGTIRTASR
jgi:curved DNA-binding protein CbpA